jgi:Tryptophan/tyrosine permease family
MPVCIIPLPTLSTTLPVLRRLVGLELYHYHHATHMLTMFAVPCTHYFYTILCTSRTAIIGGSAVPLLMFLAWNTVVLGSVDSAVVASATSSSGTFDPVQSLQGVGDYAAQLPQIVSVFSEVRI